MDRDYFNFLNGFRTGKSEGIPLNQTLKDRMKTKIMQAKLLPTKYEFMEAITADYIKISKEL